jgi:Resolvase, N terminal domain
MWDSIRRHIRHKMRHVAGACCARAQIPNEFQYLVPTTPPPLHPRYIARSAYAQQKEGTIESLVEPKRQITAAGHELVREYIDDGYSGTLLDRPALNQMRADVKTDLFDRVYFLAADRIAREVEYQRIIFGELLKDGSRSLLTARTTSRTPKTS